MRRIALILVVALVASGSTLAIAGSQRSEAPRTSAGQGPTVAEVLDALAEDADRVSTPRVACRTLECINRTLTSQGRAIKRLKAQMRAINQCEVVQGVSQFEDYQSTGGGAITGLDFDDSNDPHMWALAWICDVV